MTVSTVAPSLMIAVSLAMSIDYSLFLLSRFQSEVDGGKDAGEAVTITLATSGKIVLVSGKKQPMNTHKTTYKHLKRPSKHL